MQGSTIDVVSSRLIAGIMALRRTFGLEQNQLPVDPASRIAAPSAPQTSSSQTPSGLTSSSNPLGIVPSGMVAPTQPATALAPVQAADSATTASIPASVPAAMVNPSRQWIDFSLIEEFDPYAPRGTYLDVIA